MFAPEDEMIVIVVEDEKDQQVKIENDQVKYENDHVQYENEQVQYENEQVQYENDQLEYENDQEIEYEEEYQEEVEEMVLDEVTGEIISNKNAIDRSWSVPSEDNDSQNVNHSSISSDSHTVAEAITGDVPRHKSTTSPIQKHYIRVKNTHSNGKSKKESKNKSSIARNKVPFYSKHRNRQISVEDAHSFVKELKDTFPELAHNEEMLVTQLADLMRTVKIPSIPEEYSKFIGGLYVCSFCKKSTHTKLKSEQHYLEIHGPRYLHCFSCGADFRCLPTLYRHERSCVHPDAGIVLKARALVSTKGTRRAAILSKDSKRRKDWLMCEICQAVLSSKGSLDAHMRRHRNETPYKCSLCDRRYTTRSSLLRHLKTHDDLNKYECEKCQRVFGTHRMLISHLNTHNKYWECTYKCGKYFATEASKNLHVDAKHLNKPMPCACNLCHFQCFNISLLRCHMEQRHGLIYLSDTSMREQCVTLNSSQVTNQSNNVPESTETDLAVNNLKEIFYVNTPNAENCIEVTTAPNDDYYEIVLSSNEVNGLKEGYYEVVTSKEGHAKNETYEEIIVGTEQEVCENECEVDAPGVDCGS